MKKDLNYCACPCPNVEQQELNYKTVCKDWDGKGHVPNKLEEVDGAWVSSCHKDTNDCGFSVPIRSSPLTSAEIEKINNYFNNKKRGKK